jgi:hypothetical protein
MINGIKKTVPYHNRGCPEQFLLPGVVADKPFGKEKIHANIFCKVRSAGVNDIFMLPSGRFRR